MEQLKLAIRIAKKSISESIKKYYLNVDDEKRQKFIAYLYIVMSLFTLSFFGMFAIRPTINTITNLNRQYEDNQQVLSKLKTKLQNLEKLNVQYQSINSDLVYIFNAIPKENAIPTLSRKIENLSTSDNVALTDLRFSSIELYPATNPEIFSFTFTLNVEGSENSINKFVSDLLNFDRIISLERLITGKEGKDTFSATLTGRAYFLPE